MMPTTSVRRFPIRVLFTLATVLACATLPQPAQADCTLEWQPGYAIDAVDGFMTSVGRANLLVWDRDGEGPEPQGVLSIGNYPYVANQSLSEFGGGRYWNGFMWESLGPSVFSGNSSFGYPFLFTFQGKFILCQITGSFQWSIQRWEGGHWELMGTRIFFRPRLHVEWNGQLYVLDETGDDSFYRWDGADWVQAVPLPVTGTLDAVVFQDNLIVTSSNTAFPGLVTNYIASWNGEAYAGLGDGLPAAPNGLFVWQDKLIAPVQVGSVSIMYAWDGNSWTQMGSPLPFWGQYLWNYARFGMAQTEFEGQLYVGGYFGPTTGGLKALLARWDGNDWDLVASGTTDAVAVLELTPYQGELLIRGTWKPFAGFSQSTRLITRWDGSRFRGLSGQGFEDKVSFLVSNQEELLAGGDFDAAGDRCAVKFARLIDGKWEPMGESNPGSPGFYPIALTVWRGQPVAAASFHYINPGNSQKMARFDGSQWTEIDNNPDFLPATCSGALTAYGDDLIINGVRPTTPEGLPELRGVLRWNGQAWSQLGPTAGSAVNSKLWTLEGRLFYYGYQISPSFSGTGLWEWRETEWLNLFATTQVYDIAMYNNMLHISCTAGIQRQTSAGWEQISTVSPNSLCSINGELVLPGYFGTILTWNGSTWGGFQGLWQSHFDDGAPSYASKIVRHRDTIVVGGQFVYADPYLSDNIAVLKPSCPHGDMNCDGAIDAFDIPDFVAGLIDPMTMSACTSLVADMNKDGANNAQDLNPFVDAILGE